MTTKKRAAAVLRVAALFAGYSGLGAAGDWTAALLAGERAYGGGIAAATPAAVAADERSRDERSPSAALERGYGGACAYEAEREVSLPVDGSALVSIDAGSGELVVEGRQDRSDVAVRAVVCASREEYLEELRVTLERVGDEIVLTAHYPESRSRDGRSTARIDLRVEVPVGMSVDIDDSSGSIDVLGTGDVRIDDSSGSIRVTGAGGDVRIDDSSGGVEVQDVAGNVEIRDGSGEIEVRDVEGGVRVRDGSGGIDVAEVEADVVIEDDGSGGIDVRSVGGAFIVEDDGSGGIRYSDVAGRVDIPADARRRGGR